MSNPNIVVPEQNEGRDNFVYDISGDAHHFGPLPGTRSRALSPEEVLRKELEGLAEAAAKVAVATSAELAV